MNQCLREIADYLSLNLPDPVPRYILKKEIYEEPFSDREYAVVKKSKWYTQLEKEQGQNGAWGRFHTQDTKLKEKRVFVTTEAALKRASELSLGKDDPMVHKAIKLMERYIKGEELWTDAIEKHYHFEVAFRALIAADISVFDPYNPLVAEKNRVCAENMSKAFAGGSFDEGVWEQENTKSNEILLRAYMAYTILLLQNNPFLSIDTEQKFMDYICHREKGIYYRTDCAPADIRSLESKQFIQWLSALECLSGFSLFPDFMAERAYGHLLGEIYRLMDGEAALPAAPQVFGHYSETWKGRGSRKNDLILRILRLLKKA